MRIGPPPIWIFPLLLAVVFLVLAIRAVPF